MNVLVTGASGFIGSHLVRKLMDEGENVVSLIHDCPVWTKWLSESVKPSTKAHGTILDLHFLKRVINQYSVDTVFHLAAQSIVKRAYNDPINTYHVNVMGTVNLLEACRQLDVERILIQSTDKVYGNKIGAAVEDRLIPTEAYGTSKICTDVIAQTFTETYDMPISIARCCNVYGYDWNKRIIPNTIRSCLSGADPLIFRDDYSKRQYIHVDDVVRALKSCLSDTRHIYNVATKDVITQEEVVLKILSFFPSLKPKYVDKPSLKEIKSQSMKTNIHPSRWKPEISFHEGVKRTINSFREYA